VGAPIYRGWEVRGLGCEGVVEETASTIHAQELPPTSTKWFSTFKNTTTFTNPRLKASRRHPPAGKIFKKSKSNFGAVKVRKIRFPFNFLQYPILLLFSQQKYGMNKISQK